MGSVLDRARVDAQRIITSGGFEVDITLTPPLPDSPLAVKGLASKHWIDIQTDGIDANTKNTHITIVEKDLTDNAYPVRDGNDQVNMEGHQVDYIDSTGTSKSNTIIEAYPDETLGLIVAILNDKE